VRAAVRESPGHSQCAQTHAYEHTQTHADTHRHTHKSQTHSAIIQTSTETAHTDARTWKHTESYDSQTLSPTHLPTHFRLACANAGRAHRHTNLRPVIFVVLSAARRRGTHQHDEQVNGRTSTHFRACAHVRKKKTENGAGHPASPARDAESSGFSRQMARGHRTCALYGRPFAPGCARAVAVPAP
jgi:hypothetical protein